MSTKKAAFKSSFGVKLKEIRKLGGWNQEVLAAQLGISRDTLSRYERGELSPSLEVFGKMMSIFSALEITAEDMLAGEEAYNSLPTLSLKSVGWAKGFSFSKGGAFIVGAGQGDLLRIIEEFTSILPEGHIFSESLEQLIQYLDELETPIIEEMELVVPIAQHSAKLTPLLPEAKTAEQAMFDKYLAEKEKSESLQKQLDKLSTGKKKITQTIAGTNHTIAGNDIKIER
ncbi:hypothetical protein MED121_01460 [Marinomonas sp. MED121]|uniref:helix-turn-helix domain-containing protein n=1 Tax=Marinomonas sp. MED121 TaxID=314277 RepID=UPI0000690AFD|nr:helix-turn-helix transcriptional regulator [Marinomonas sp. MED121]EAQ65837.1 hypothetical protein MED121_01460 [Marinomonas sp. MED121]